MCKKVSLVMDNPEICEKCEFYVPSLVRSDRGMCCIINKLIENKITKLSKCPFKELPEEESEDEDLCSFDRGWTAGFNACLQKIKGENSGRSESV